MTLSDFIPSELITVSTLGGGGIAYITVAPNWISDNFGFPTHSGYQIALLLIVIFFLGLILGRVTKLSNETSEEAQTDGGQVLTNGHGPMVVRPTGWAGLAGLIAGGTFGYPFGVIGIVIGGVAGFGIGVLIEYTYLNHSHLLISSTSYVRQRRGIEEELASLRQAKTSMQSKLSRKTDRIEEYESQIKELQSELAELDGLRDEVSYLRKEREDLVDRLEELEAELKQERRSQIEFVEDVEETISRFQDELSRERREPTSVYFDIFENPNHQWGWRVVDERGQIRVQSGDLYSSEPQAKNSISDFLEVIREGTEHRSPYNVMFEIYEEGAGAWKWRLSGDEEVLAESGNMYSSQEGAMNSLNSVRSMISSAD